MEVIDIGINKTIYIGDEIYIGYKKKEDVFRPVYYNGIKTHYAVSLLGNVYNTTNMNKLVPAVMPNGYLKVLIYYEQGQRVQLFVHRIVATAFLDNPDNLPVVNHKDGNKKNNDCDNLEWVTQSRNAKHAHEMGLAHAKLGEQSVFAKTTDNNIRKICEEIVLNELTPPEIAKKYGVSRKTVTLIINGKRWVHISEQYDFSHYDKMRKVDKEKVLIAESLIRHTDLTNQEISEQSGISYSYVCLLRTKYSRQKSSTTRERAS